MFNIMKSAVTIFNTWLLISMSNVYCHGQKKTNSTRTPRCEYKPVILLSERGIQTFNLHIHKASNTLFFNFVNHPEYHFEIATFNLHSKEMTTIPGIDGGCSVAIDQSNNIIYLGGSNGIFTYNVTTKLADAYAGIKMKSSVAIDQSNDINYLGGSNGIFTYDKRRKLAKAHAEIERNIWAMYFKYRLFYIKYPTKRLYIHNGEDSFPVKGFEGFEVDSFFMGSNGEIIYTNQTGVYYRHAYQLLGTKLISNLSHVRQIVEDNMHNVYMATDSGVYVLTPKIKCSKILNVTDVQGLTFDKFNNLIYSNGSTITMLIFNSSDVDKSYCLKNNLAYSVPAKIRNSFVNDGEFSKRVFVRSTAIPKRIKDFPVYGVDENDVDVKDFPVYGVDENDVDVFPGEFSER